MFQIVRYLVERYKNVDNLKTNTSLSHLCLRNVLTVEHKKYVTNALCFNNSLIFLDLSEKDIDRIGSESLAELLQSKSSNLRILRLTQCNMTDMIASPLLKALAKNRQVTYLYLDNNKMGNDSANRIAAIIVITMSLTCLSVSSNKWNIDGMAHIA